MKQNRIVEDCIGHVESAIGSIEAHWKNLSKKDKDRWNNYEQMLLNKLEKKKQQALNELFS